ncbi:hypothetical protein GCM10027088_16120 [Nocardia goodfellowii]|uniref:Uncharacterized protein n=1 Tax=Nocardia goodfellowii TaxID=882446 RepID=A0ABS4QD25_9NOCA|nr:hypothetical protein [Nocardia goodfellowii]
MFGLIGIRLIDDGLAHFAMDGLQYPQIPVLTFSQLVQSIETFVLGEFLRRARNEIVHSG